MKPRIVISAVNFVEGGPLAVFRDALQVLSDSFKDRYDIVALVHRRSLFTTTDVTYLEFPGVKASWARRLRFEYRDCFALSQELNAVLWFAMHDITPHVVAERRAVYCHNPAPFFRTRMAEALLDPVVAAFTLLYRYVYRIGIRKNDFVVVQQQWMRTAFQQRYRPRAVVVAHPSIEPTDKLAVDDRPHQASEPWRFFYPCLPRVFKNVELLLQAAAWLEENAPMPFELALTLSGTEHAYTRSLYQRYSHLHSVRWLGHMSRAEVFAQNRAADAMLFPSKLETWGMPLSEFRCTGKPIFAADLPYAHETLAGYGSVHFFDPADGVALGRAMLRFMRGELNLQPEAEFVPPAPFAEGWEQLFCLLLDGINPTARTVMS